jgi:hypothetical protein
MPRLSREEIRRAPAPRWPTNRHGIEAPDDICGDYNCACAERARKIMTDAEYQLAFGVPKEFGLRGKELDEFWASYGGTTVTIA